MCNFYEYKSTRRVNMSVSEQRNQSNSRHKFRVIKITHWKLRMREWFFNFFLFGDRAGLIGMQRS